MYCWTFILNYQICTLFLIKRSISHALQKQLLCGCSSADWTTIPGSRIARYRATILLVVVHSLQLHCLQHIHTYTLSKNFCITFLNFSFAREISPHPRASRIRLRIAASVQFTERKKDCERRQLQSDITQYIFPYVKWEK